MMIITVRWKGLQFIRYSFMNTFWSSRINKYVRELFKGVRKHTLYTKGLFNNIVIIPKIIRL